MGLGTVEGGGALLRRGALGEEQGRIRAEIRRETHGVCTHSCHQEIA